MLIIFDKETDEVIDITLLENREIAPEVVHGQNYDSNKHGFIYKPDDKLIWNKKENCKIKNGEIIEKTEVTISLSCDLNEESPGVYEIAIGQTGNFVVYFKDLAGADFPIKENIKILIERGIVVPSKIKLVDQSSAGFTYTPPNETISTRLQIQLKSKDIVIKKSGILCKINVIQV